MVWHRHSNGTCSVVLSQMHWFVHGDSDWWTLVVCHSSNQTKCHLKLMCEWSFDRMLRLCCYWLVSSDVHTNPIRTILFCCCHLFGWVWFASKYNCPLRCYLELCVRSSSVDWYKLAGGNGNRWCWRDGTAIERTIFWFGQYNGRGKQCDGDWGRRTFRPIEMQSTEFGQ